MEMTGLILFIIGFLLGGITIWSIRQKEVEAVRKNQDQLKDLFGDLSNEARIQSQKKFLELAEDKFSSILGKSDDQLSKKKELIDTSKVLLGRKKPFVTGLIPKEKSGINT